MWIVASFTREGVPATGLSPEVVVRDVDTSVIVINGASMNETGDGFYSYDFSGYNPSKDYTVICDSVTLSGVERYSYGSSGEYNEVLDSIESTVGVVDLRTLLIRKIQTNRLELMDGDADNWTLYDDDAITPLLTFDVSDKDGNIIVQQPNTPSRRSGAAGIISGSLTSDIYMRKSVYDTDDDGFVNGAENVSDGIYTSTASGVKYAVDNSHLPCILGTKCIDENAIGDQLVVKYDAATDRLIYGIPSVSGTTSGTISHKWLLDLTSDDHPQYIPVDGSRGFTSTVSGVQPTQTYHLTTKQYVDSAITTATGALTTDHGSLAGLTDDDHIQYSLTDGSRGFTSTISGIYPVDDNHLATKQYVDTVVISGIGIDHGVLGGLGADDHPQYILADGSRGFISTVSGVDPSQDYHLTTKQYVDSAITTATGALTTNHGELTGLTDDDHLQYILIDGSRDFTSTVEYSSHPTFTIDEQIVDKKYVDEAIISAFGVNKSGRELVANGANSTTVSYNSSFDDTEYSLFTELENTADSPASEYALTITDKTASGFTVNYSGDMDSANYILNWYATTSGVSGSDYLTSVEDDTSPVLGGDLDLGDYNIILNTNPTTSGLGSSGEISRMRIDHSETGRGCPLHMDTDGNWITADATFGTTSMPCAAMALEDGTGMKYILWRGIIRKDTWSWTPGDVLYVSTVLGAITNVAPTVDWSQCIGIAIASNIIKFDPGFDPGEYPI